MYCGYCGKQITDNHNYCPYCGCATATSAFHQNTSFNNGYYENHQPSSYTPGPIKDYNLFSAYKEMFKKYAQFNGRSRRSEYWYAVLMNGIIMMAAYFILMVTILGAVISSREPSVASIGIVILLCLVLLLYCFAVMVPCIALGVRRLHDTGKSGLYMLFSLIPYAGSIVLIVFMAADSQPGPNQYGPNPKGM